MILTLILPVSFCFFKCDLRKFIIVFVANIDQYRSKESL